MEIVTTKSESVNTKRFELPQAWAEFLEPFKWNWFATIAPSDNPHPESLDKLYDLFIHNLNRSLYGQHYWKDKRKGVFWARATEYQNRGAVHHHALIGGIPDYENPVTWRNWLYSHSTMSKIEPYRPEAGAEYYLSKSAYAWKRGEIDCSKSLAYEQDGKRICARSIHESFCARYTSLTKPDLNQYSW
jgi:hypothetical protein